MHGTLFGDSEDRTSRSHAPTLPPHSLKIASRFYFKEDRSFFSSLGLVPRLFVQNVTWWCYCKSKFPPRSVEKCTYVYTTVNSKRTDLSYSFMHTEDEVTVPTWFLFVPCSQWILTLYITCTRIHLLKAEFAYAAATRFHVTFGHFSSLGEVKLLCEVFARNTILPLLEKGRI